MFSMHMALCLYSANDVMLIFYYTSVIFLLTHATCFICLDKIYPLSIIYNTGLETNTVLYKCITDIFFLKKSSHKYMQV